MFTRFGRQIFLGSIAGNAAGWFSLICWCCCHFLRYVLAPKTLVGTGLAPSDSTRLDHAIFHVYQTVCVFSQFKVVSDHQNCETASVKLAK